MKFTRNTKRKTIRKSRRIRKSRKNNRKKNRSRGRVRKGGFFSLGINEKIFKNWKRKFPMKNDCCPCVFSFLGLPDYEVLQLKAQFQNWSKGMDVVDIENVFKNTNSDYDFKFGKSNQNLSGPDRKRKLDTAIAWLKKNIPKGAATVGGIQWCGGSIQSSTCPTSASSPWAARHCFLIGNDESQGLYVADVQAEKVYAGNQEVKKWLMNPPNQDVGVNQDMQTELLWILLSGRKDGKGNTDWGNPLRVIHPAAAQDAAKDEAQGVANMEID
jgi:hypothetical protein